MCFVCLSVVACGDRKDFLQFMRILHFRRKCKMRMNCKKDAGKAAVGKIHQDSRLFFPQLACTPAKYPGR
jgi:hypothetical protein